MGDLTGVGIGRGAGRAIARPAKPVKAPRSVEKCMMAARRWFGRHWTSSCDLELCTRQWTTDWLSVPPSYASLPSTYTFHLSSPRVFTRW